MKRGYEEKIIESMKHWGEIEESSHEKWDNVMIDCFGKDKLLEIRQKQYRSEEIKALVKGVAFLTAIATICLFVLFLFV